MKPAVPALPALILFASVLVRVTCAAGGSPSAEALAAHLSELKDVKTLHAKFICEKRLEALETPLVSRGQVWIEKPDAVRFTTEKPYTSELILHGGKVFQKSQHETGWTKTNQSTRPGLTAVMSQLGGWSTGRPIAIQEMYAVNAIQGEIPPPPKDGASPRTDDGVDCYQLAPRDKDLAKSVKDVRLAIDRKTHALRFAQITTAQGDQTRYWFYDVQFNPKLPADVFSPPGVK